VSFVLKEAIRLVQTTARDVSLATLALAVLLSLPAAKQAAAAARCATKADCLKAIAEAQRDTRSMEAGFRQVKHLTLLDEPLVSTGRFLFAKPDRVRLEVTEPEPATIVIRGGDIRIPGLSEADRQALSGSPMVAMFTQLGAVFSGSVDQLEEGFEVAATAEGDGVRLVLVPRSAEWKKAFQRMQLDFAGAKLVVREVRIEDALGDRLEITMENVKRNVDLADDLFEP
jgi:outer membrane lipoprotein-sorting protein